MKSYILGHFFFILSFELLLSQDMPTVVYSNSQSLETGINIEFVLSDIIDRSDNTGWLEQDNWFTINFYNIIKLLGLALIFQIILGVLTILNGAQMFLASMHQIGSIALISISVYLLFFNNRKLTNSF